VTPEQIITVVREAALFFGGAAAVVVALIAWLGTLLAKRILQTEGLRLGHELGLSKATFERQLDLLLEYFATFYRHYRLCQDTANADAIRAPDGTITYTKDTFLNELDSFLENWHAQEGKIRLFLPAELLSVHSEAIDAFNEFKRAVQAFHDTDERRDAKITAFRQVHDVKDRMETGLRQFLRVERFFKG
jgi:hypothetical protein